MCWENLFFGWEWGFFQVLLLVFTICVAWCQLGKQSKAEAITALAKLRELLTSEKNREVHRLLSPEDEQGKVSLDEEKFDVDWVDVFNYLGTLELGVIMKEKGIIEGKEFCSQFGYRIENIFDKENDSDFHKAVRKHIEIHKKYYEKLFKGYEIMNDSNKQLNPKS